MRARLLVIMLFFPSLCIPGTEMEFKCRKCGLKDTYVNGNLMMGYQRVAFCRQENRFVSIFWRYRESPPKPIRVEHGISVYQCPFCKRRSSTFVGSGSVPPMRQQEI